VIELRAKLRIGKIAPGRHVDVVELNVTGKDGSKMPAVSATSPVVSAHAPERQFRKDGDTVVAELPVDRAVRIAKPSKEREGKIAVPDLDLLEAEDIGRVAAYQSSNRSLAEPDRVHVPGDDSHLPMGRGPAERPFLQD
jgi:hypothetical protein